MIIGVDASRANVDSMTGIERYTFEVCRRLPRLMPAATVRLYVREPLRQHWPAFETANVEVRVLRWPPRVFWSHLRLAWETIAHPPDVLFVPASTIPLVHGGQAVTTIHDVAFLEHPTVYRRPMPVVKTFALFRFVHRLLSIVSRNRWGLWEGTYQHWSWQRAQRAATLLTVSEHSAHRMKHFVPSLRARVVVAPLGLTMPQMVPTPDRDFAARYGVTANYFLYIGRLEKKKNIEHLLLAYAAYSAHEKNRSDLVLVGMQGSDWEDIVPTLDGLQCRHRIHIFNHVPDDEKWRWLVGARALALVSYDEGFGLPALEAAAVGVPVVAAQAGALPEVMKSAAIFVDPASIDSICVGLTRVDGDDQTREICIQRGYERARQFRWDATATIVADELSALALKIRSKNGTVKPDES